MKLTHFGHLILITFALVMTLYALDNVKFNTMLQGQTINIFPGISFDDCWTKCEQRASCGSINYVRRLHFCYLNSKQQPSETSVQVGSIFREKSDQSDYVKCGKNECKKGEVCDPSLKQCSVEECEPPHEIPGVDILGNMLSIGSKRLLRCREGYIPTVDNVSPKEAICEQNGWRNMQLECVPLTCTALADIGVTSTRFYHSYNEGSQTVIKIFCEFVSDEQPGHSFLSKETLNVSVNISDYFNRKDHVMLRHIINETQYESKIEVLEEYRKEISVSVFNSENPDFSGQIAEMSYLFIGFIPKGFGNHTGRTMGYTCNGQDYTFQHCDSNKNSYFAIYESKNKTSICYKGDQVKDGWKVGARPVEPSRNIPTEVFFNIFEIGMGGCGCFERNCDTNVTGVALGLPFE